MPRLPPLPDRAQAPGRIPSDEKMLHRAAHALYHRVQAPGPRTQGNKRVKGARVLDVIERARTKVESDVAAENIVRRIAGKSLDRDPTTLHTEYMLIVPVEDKDAASEAVAEAMFGPLQAVGWLEDYEAAMAANHHCFDGHPYVSIAAGVVTHHVVRGVVLTADQHADLMALAPVSLTVIQLPSEGGSAVVDEELGLRGLVLPPTGDE